MKPLNLTEWAESLRLSPDSQIADYAGEVLALVASADRLYELEDRLGQNGFYGPISDDIDNLLDELEDLRAENAALKAPESYDL